MDESTEFNPQHWLKLVDAAIVIGVSPGTLYRRWRYRQPPESMCRKVDNVLYFNREMLQSLVADATESQDRLL